MSNGKTVTRRNSSMAIGGSPIKVGSSRMINGKKAYATSKLPQRPKNRPQFDYNKVNSWAWSANPVKKASNVKKSKSVKKPTPKSIEYYRGGKLVGISKYRQGEGTLGVTERFKRDSK